MAAVVPDSKAIRAFANTRALEAWMRANHAKAPELWLKVHKKNSGLQSVTCAEALDVMLCWGWIDGIRKGLDEKSFLQRYTPRRARSIWSQINREHVARLIEARRMQPAGQKQIDLARADGRWDAAYAPIRKTSADNLPPDLMRAIKANKKALATFSGLSRQNLFSLVFRTNNMKTPEGRARKIATLVEMLARGETIVPQKPPRKKG
ncbi:MAG TPA: YdeI/OmpD-associated family protein [Steroidobacteraceae bacterium]|nr:YdeI/OmpD-associated family protein [Steroidobacteraceae bacterium]